MEYKDFRTGLTFKEVRNMLKIKADAEYEKGRYMFITRHTVLGKWHEIKKQMFNEYCFFEDNKELIDNEIMKQEKQTKLEELIF